MSTIENISALNAAEVPYEPDSYEYPLTSPTFVEMVAKEQITKAVTEFDKGGFKAGILDLPVLEINATDSEQQRLASFEADQEIYANILNTAGTFGPMRYPMYADSGVTEWSENGRRAITRLYRISPNVAFAANVLLDEDGKVDSLKPQVWFSRRLIDEFIWNNFRGNKDFGRLYMS